MFKKKLKNQMTTKFFERKQFFKFFNKILYTMSNCTGNEIKPNTIRKQTHATENNPRFTSFGSIFKNARIQVLSLVVLAFLFFTAQAQTTVVNVTNTVNCSGGICNTSGSWIVPTGGPYKIRITAKGGKGGNGNTDKTQGGKGDVMIGEFTVNSGQELQYIVGAFGY